MAEADVAQLVETIDDEPDRLHPESTPSTLALIALGARSVPAVLPLLSSPNRLTRRRAVHVLEMVTMARFGFRRGHGWDDFHGEDRWRAFWSDMGGLSHERGGPVEDETIAKWRTWSDRERS
jgi:hypothetical protein